MVITFHCPFVIGCYTVTLTFNSFMDLFSVLVGRIRGYSEWCQTSKMERFSKIVNAWKLLTIFTEHSSLDVCQGSKCTTINALLPVTLTCELFIIASWSTVNTKIYYFVIFDFGNFGLFNFKQLNFGLV